MTTVKKLGITVVLLWTFGVTIMRGIRFPNGFAMAHWVIDYRFGLVKRGLVGSIFSLTTRIMHIHPTEQLINILSIIVFTVYCLVLIALGLRIIHRAGWSTVVILTVLVFFSSPFIVMSAKLIGYFDNMFIVLLVISVILLLKGRIWSAAWVQVISVLVHESSLLVGFPIFCLAWLLANSKHQESDGVQLPFRPLLLPVGAFLFLALIQRLFLSGDFNQALSKHLSDSPFAVVEPIWFAKIFTTSVYTLFMSERVNFINRISSVSMYGLVLPSLLAILCSILDTHNIQRFGGKSIVLLGSVCLAPQMIHLVATDTTRIWTYSILCAFIALWIYAELFTARRDVSPSIMLLCLTALIVNILSLTPFWIPGWGEADVDHFRLKTRLLLYSPVIVTALALMLRQEIVLIKNRISI